ncbi:unnamed protein product [Angiostrongylus costaricensis]|uniref:DUF5880 domain-containing protein n=1 Tax=Angiostrongylus costaricensis TaxID=334426 RepID=A0A0R3PXF6_ANGCS|nr:unnamed protein product [Angiostrongylus costaricensis]
MQEITEYSTGPIEDDDENPQGSSSTVILPKLALKQKEVIALVNLRPGATVVPHQMGMVVEEISVLAQAVHDEETVEEGHSLNYDDGDDDDDVEKDDNDKEAISGTDDAKNSNFESFDFEDDDKDFYESEEDDDDDDRAKDGEQVDPLLKITALKQNEKETKVCLRVAKEQMSRSPSVSLKLQHQLSKVK